MQSNTNAPPTYVAYAGLVRASVWESGTGKFVRHKITLSRLYRQNSAWHRAKTFCPSELIAVAEAIADAKCWIEQRTHRQTN